MQIIAPRASTRARPLRPDRGWHAAHLSAYQIASEYRRRGRSNAELDLRDGHPLGDKTWDQPLLIAR